MTALLIADHDFAVREFDLLRRLEVGLLSSGSPASLAIPERVGEIEDNESLATPLRYRLRGGPITRALRVSHFNKAIDSSKEIEGSIDVIHVFGTDAWRFATEVAASHNAALLLELWSAASVQTARRLERTTPHLAAQVRWIASSNAMADHARRFLKWPIEASPWGTHVHQQPPDERSTDEAGPAILLLGFAEPARISTALEGVARILTDHPGTMLFVPDDAFEHNSRLWTHARELDLLSNLSVLSTAQATREIFLAYDLALSVDGLGEHRSVILDVLASGVPLIAARDPLVDWLSDHDAAELHDQPKPDLWARAIARTLENDSQTRDRTVRAQEFVREHHLASSHVHRVAALHQAAAAGANSLEFTRP